jgi:small GTP-binding protein
MTKQSPQVDGMSFGMVEYDFLVKLVCVGNSGVGKSSLIHRYSRREFNPHFVSTIGVDFEIKEIDILGKKVKLQLWDCAGNERFRTITTSYYRGASVIMLVYDIMDESSMCAIPDWIREIRQHNPDGRILLVGNKLDCWNNHVAIPFKLPKDIQTAIDQLEPSMKMVLTSAKQNQNVDDAFVQLTTEHIKERLANPLPISSKHSSSSALDLHDATERPNNQGFFTCCSS